MYNKARSLLLLFFLLPCARISLAQNYTISTFAGYGPYGFSGDGGLAVNAQLAQPRSIAIDDSGNVYIADYGNNSIRKVNTNGIISTFAGIDSLSGYSGDGGPAVNAELNHPTGVSTDHNGNIYIADIKNNCIRKINTSAIITTIAGTGTAGYSGDGGQATNAELNQPWRCTPDDSGNIYIADYMNNRIRKINTSGVISTIAGTGTAGYSGDSNLAVNAEINGPTSVILDSIGNIYFTDFYNNCVRKIDTNGVITTIAGTGTGGYSGDGGPATNAMLYWPIDIAFDHEGNLYIVDNVNRRVRKVDTNGIITTVAGLYNPQGISIDQSDNIYIVETGYNRIQKMTKITGINEINRQDQLLVYPNPGNGIFHLENLPEKSTIVVYDLLGKVIYQGTSNSLNLSNQPNGMYLLRINSERRCFVKKLMVEK